MTNGSPNATSLPVQLLAFINTNKLGPIGEVRFFAGCSLNLLWLNVRKWHKADGTRWAIGTSASDPKRTGRFTPAIPNFDRSSGLASQRMRFRAQLSDSRVLEALLGEAIPRAIAHGPQAIEEITRCSSRSFTTCQQVVTGTVA